MATNAPDRPATLRPVRPRRPHPPSAPRRGRLQLVYDCWTLLKLPDGTSRRPFHLSRGIEEPETCCLKQREAARSTGFYRDALLTYAVILAQLNWQELPDSLTRVTPMWMARAPCGRAATIPTAPAT